MSELTRERLAELLAYDPDTGLFVRVKTTRARWKAGQTAGGINRNGYVQIQIDRKIHYGHRLAFLWVEGVMPHEEVDHINGNKSDNRWSNLRHATRTQQQMNCPRRKDNDTGFKNVYRRPGGTYYAQIKLSGRTKCLGTFSTPEDAHAAYMEAAHLLFGAFARAG